MTLLPLILASDSPRRVEIMNYFKMPFDKVSHTFDERTVPWESAAHDYAQKLSTAKATNVAARFPTRTVIAADTIVVIDGQLLTKPGSLDEARQMLHRIAGNWHEVITSISISHEGSIRVRSDETRVLIQPLNDAQREAYLRLNVWSDKVGGYAIQGAGSILVQRIEGCYYNVIGLPIVPLTAMLAEIGIDMWEYLS
jgi:septum formation protein